MPDFPLTPGSESSSAQSVRTAPTPQPQAVSGGRPGSARDRDEAETVDRVAIPELQYQSVTIPSPERFVSADPAQAAEAAAAAAAAASAAAAAAAAAATAAAPTRRPRYEFVSHLGSGGMADVYRARDTELGREVAIKLFRDEGATTADVQRREREIRLLSRLNHIGLVAMHDAGSLVHEGRERRYLVMELVEGRSLAHRLVNGPMKQRQVADIGAQMADVLSYVHSRSVIHRDIKPENILVTETPTFGYTLIAKLADFGVAQFTGGTRLTSDGSIMGTAAYISPEQARGEEIGPASDVYSLGLVLLEALRGEREYTGTPIEAALARLHRPPVIPGDLPPEWRALLAAMTADDPDVRPTAHDVAATMRDTIRAMITESRGKRGLIPFGRRRAAATAAAAAAEARRTRVRVLVGVVGIVLATVGICIAVTIALAAGGALAL